ncbi:MAG: RDD family protein, partial [Akkermansiaceae bacterium]
MAEQKRRIDTLQSIELAEGIEIHLRAAGPYLRFIAYFLDLIFQILTVVAIFFLLMFSLGFWGINVASGVFNLCYFFVAWLYPVIFECGKKGATPGKRIFGLRVVD